MTTCFYQIAGYVLFFSSRLSFSAISLSSYRNGLLILMKLLARVCNKIILILGYHFSLLSSFPFFLVLFKYELRAIMNYFASIKEFLTQHKQVRNETAEDFLDLLKAWENLCKKYINGDKDASVNRRKENSRKNNSNKKKSSSSSDEEEYEVWKLVDICYGDPYNHGNRGLRFKVLVTSHFDTS